MSEIQMLSGRMMLSITYHNGHHEHFQIDEEPTVLGDFLRFSGDGFFHAVPMPVVRRYTLCAAPAPRESAQKN